ncbi:CynX/NimT family MFS transporter [Phytohabitans suffuscus]|uniref:CynX/NimT family MFS transporter n=1 Tax=Phytohabitans suffuscus TaxID=624315 RepID=UPI001564F2A5|nr:MFS transporter [Phytohabitans suffuscus]
MVLVAPPASTLNAPVPAAVDTASPTRTRGTALVLTGILLVALNLRIAITSLGALLEEVRTGLQLSGAMAGVVTTMPTIAFAAFGALAPWLVRRFSPGRVVVAAMVALVAGEVVRVATGSTVVFIATSALALAGIAVANILLPLLVRQHFPNRTGLVTGAYTVSLTAGASVAAASAVPIADAFGSWRAGLGAWSVLALIAVLPWLPAVLRRTSAHATAPRLVGRVRPARTRVGWAMAIYFGTQALSGYATMGWLAQLFRDSGYRPQAAGLLLAGVTAVGIPVALVMPALAMRLRSLRPLVLALSAMMIASYVGLALAPHDGAVAWVVLLSIGQGAFPLALVTIGLRARTPEGTVALSAFTQCLGYLIAALGPLVVGTLYEITGGWNLPIGFLIAAALVQVVAGLAVARPRFVED